MPARYYDPEIGGFISPDPVGEFWNSFSYTGGNPINLIDPLGLSTWTYNGEVAAVFDDGDLGVYEMSLPMQNDVCDLHIGETAFWNEFQEGNFINIGMSVDA
ncbi:hypothetical protein DRN98_07030, partial [Methanosarcinales archaeon]